MSTSGNKALHYNFRRTTVTYLGISIFCIVFYLVYDRFSHGVHSPFMTWLCGWPFVLGVLPSVFFWKSKVFRSPGRISFNIWNSGVAALTVSSLLRGIFEIAGTASDYQEWLMRAGGVMLLCAGLVYLSPKRS